MMNQSDYILKQQEEICKKFDSAFMNSPSFLKVGISINVKEGAIPINGLRHLPEGDTTGWYIWGGEEFSDDPNFFVPLHVIHLKEWCPLVVKYLGLEPGFRFLITNEYEDVWKDESLLNS